MVKGVLQHQIEDAGEGGLADIKTYPNIFVCHKSSVSEGGGVASAAL
jgi:hypothetical protein